MRLGVLVLALALATAGCIEDNLVACGTQLCPAGDMCTPGGCASRDEVAACANAVDGAACTTDTIVVGTCWSSACREAVCGNGVVDARAGEVCDDGNQRYADGCSGDCRSIETCGNGTVDRAVGEECDDSNLIDGDSCRSTCMVPRCGDGIVDAQNGEGCDEGFENSNAAGASCRSNCQPQRCGDSVLDAGETCDDGNLSSGDGCSGDCESLEVCGNSYIDVVNDEQCDDTNAAGLSGDGCTSTCTVEVDLWRETTPAPPPPRVRAAMVYDDLRDRLIVFGGDDGSVFPSHVDTWEFDGIAWHMGRPTVEPDISYERNGLVFDRSRGVAVLVSSDAQDVWEWDGTEWRDVTPASVPLARYRFGLAYHAGSQRVVMFGGQSDSPSIRQDETWLWDGTSWELAQPQLSPPASDVMAMAENPDGAVVLYVGGAHPRNETWHWTGVTWEKVTLTADGPYLSQWVPMLYDGTHMVMYTTNSLEEKWVYDGTSWELVTPDSNAVIRGSALAFNSDLDRIYSFGGGAFYEPTSILRDLRFGAWSVVPARTSPPAQAGAGLVYDSLRGRVLTASGGSGGFIMILNGTYTTSNSDQTWAYVDDRWERLPMTPAPELVYVHAAFDPLRDRMVMFGGLRENRELSNETWELIGSTWTQRTPVTSPPASSGSSMVFDLDDGLTLLFEPTDLGKVWEWDGVNWTPRTAIAGPSPRTSFALAYDSRRDRVVLHGGSISSTILDETWEYDGTTWTLMSATGAPSRSSGSLVYDPVRAETVLVGGYVSSGVTADAPWSWNGTRWKRIATPFAPPGNLQPLLAYDAVNTRVVSYGGRQPGGFAFSIPEVIPTWVLASGSSSNPRDACASDVDTDGDGLAACADPDCWGRCAPLCPPGMSCDPSWPTCGDGVCSPVEDAAICSADC